MEQWYGNHQPYSGKGLYVNLCGWQDCGPDFSVGPSIRHVYILHYITKGRGYYEVNGDRYEVNVGEIFVIRPDDLVLYYSDKDNPWSICYICFMGDGASECVEKCGIGVSDFVLKQNNTVFYQSIAECMDFYTKKGFVSQFMFASCLYKCLSGIEESKRGSLSIRNTSAEYVNSGIVYMQYHCGEGLSVSDVAAAIGLDRSYFYRIFKQIKGVTPEKYLIDLRIERAKELVSRGLPFKEVAFSVGIRDVYYFSKLFKKVTGKTPTDYKNAKNAEA